MNREIKFRGKTAKGEWLYGYYLEKELCDGAGRCAYIKFDGSQEVIVLKETVGQFTGLCDRNGKDIYEGDIFQTDRGIVAVVEWEREGRFLAFTYDRKIVYVNREPLVKVISNIHDNPDLLTIK
jgi:uncharacterized phage protein (TIGR01671 family)